MWNNYHITPNMSSSGSGVRIKFGGDRQHKIRKAFPERDIHKISNIEIRADNESRFETDYQSKFDDAEKQRTKKVYFNTKGNPVPLDSPSLKPAGISTSPLKQALQSFYTVATNN